MILSSYLTGWWGFFNKPGSINKKGEIGSSVEFHLSYLGEPVVVSEFEVSSERNELLYLDNKDEMEDES
jgi:hypothetical protein